LPLFFRDGEGQGLDELPLIVHMVGEALAEGPALAEEPARPLEPAAAEVDRVFSVDILIGTVCSGLEMGWWFRW